MSTMTVHRPTWTPTPEITQHDGRPLHPKMIFFAPPPPDIGPVVTAYSSVKNNGTPRRIHWHLVSEALSPVFGLAVFVSMFAFILVKNFLPFSSDGLIFTSSLLLTLLICAIPARLSLRPCIDKDSVCSYVGEQGVAEYRRTETGGLNEKILRFASFTVLRKKITNAYRKQYSNRGWHYSGTEYCLVWGHDRGESIRFTAPTNHTPWFTVKRRPSGGLMNSILIVGTYYSKAGRPRRGDSYYLAASAERIWTAICLQRAQAELEQSGAVQVSIAGGGSLEVKPGWLTVINAAGTHRYRNSEVALSCEDGKVVIGRVDPKFPRKRSDVCVIDQASINNLMAFLILFHRIVPIMLEDSQSPLPD